MHVPGCLQNMYRCASCNNWWCLQAAEQLPHQLVQLDLHLSVVHHHLFSLAEFAKASEIGRAAEDTASGQPQ